MRYGNPSIESALENLQGVHRLIVMPLFPQYSSAATGSAIEVVLQEVQRWWNIPEIIISRDFYNDPSYIEGYTRLIEENIYGQEIEKLIFSYHGLPQRHIKKSGCVVNKSCTKGQVCPNVDANNVFCYRAQCYETTHLLAKNLGLEAEHYQVAFQSRLGKTPWIKPYTDVVLPELIKQGIRNIAIVCPSFVADCLETLEEINIRAREQWKMLGGKKFVFIPCLNTHPIWIEGMVNKVKNF